MTRYTPEQWDDAQTDKQAARNKRLAWWTYVLAELWAFKSCIVVGVVWLGHDVELSLALVGVPYMLAIPALCVMGRWLWSAHHRIEAPMPPRWRW